MLENVCSSLPRNLLTTGFYVVLNEVETAFTYNLSNLRSHGIALYSSIKKILTTWKSNIAVKSLLFISAQNSEKQLLFNVRGFSYI